MKRENLRPSEWGNGFWIDVTDGKVYVKSDVTGKAVHIGTDKEEAEDLREVELAAARARSKRNIKRRKYNG